MAGPSVSWHCSLHISYIIWHHWKAAAVGSKDSQSFLQNERWQLYCLLGKGELVWRKWKNSRLGICNPGFQPQRHPLLAPQPWGKSWSVSTSEKWSRDVVRLKCFMKITLMVLSDTDTEKSKQHAETTMEWVESLSQQVDDVIKLVLFVLVAIGCDRLLMIIWDIASHTHGGKLADFLQLSKKERIPWSPRQNFLNLHYTRHQNGNDKEDRHVDENIELSYPTDGRVNWYPRYGDCLAVFPKLNIHSTECIPMSVNGQVLKCS